VTTTDGRQHREFVTLSPGVDVAGPMDGSPIVLLHAASFTRRSWLLPMRLLAQRYRVYAIDLPGHGECPDREFDYERALRLIETFLADVVRRPAVLVGISLGGCLAMEVAARRADQVSGLVLTGSAFDPRGAIARIVLTGESLVFPRCERKLIENLHNAVRLRLSKDAADAIVEGGSYWHAAAAAVKQLRGRDFVRALKLYNGPLLILSGHRDWVHRTAEQAFVKASGNAVVETISGGSHVCILDDPETYAAAVERFAATVFAARKD